MIQKFHPVICPSCGSDLTQKHTVYVHLSLLDGQEFYSNVSESGLLRDRDDLVLNGYHIGTFCCECDERLEDMARTTRFTWKELFLKMASFTADEFEQDVTILDVDDEFFGCVGLGQVPEDDVLDKGHWFLKVDRGDGQ